MFSLNILCLYFVLKVLLLVNEHVHKDISIIFIIRWELIAILFYLNVT